MKILIFTDLDGTLLNHDDYSYKDARPALDRIGKEKIPLVFITSKTRKEIRMLQDELSVNDPFVVENGGGIFFPAGYRDFKINDCVSKEGYSLIQLGKSYEEIRSFFAAVKDEFGMEGFGDMGVQKIAGLTGLSIAEARLAKEREFTEPFVTTKGNRIDSLRHAAFREGMKITKGGRFYHLIGVDQDKGKAVEITKELFQANFGRGIVSIGLGDSENDIPMLEAVDMSVLIPKANGTHEHVEIPAMIKATYPGSRGWNEAVMEILDSLL